jgi:hypothetical protein
MGTVNMTSTPQTITIDAVDLTRAVPLKLSETGYYTNYLHYANYACVSVRLVDSTTLEVRTGAGTTDDYMRVAWGVIEFPAEVVKSLQSGSWSPGTLAYTYISISEVDPAKTLVFVSNYSTASYTVEERFRIRGYLYSPTSLRLERGTTLSDSGYAYWYVLEFV